MHFVDAKALLTRQNGMNLYRGCAHGCVYFEVKRNAPALLEDILKKRRKRIVISTGSMSDPYQPCEKELQLTRQCLELLERYGFGASVITKSDLVLRDLELFDRIHQKAKGVLQMTLTVADDPLSRVLEPNVCTTTRRYEVLKAFQRAGVPTVVWMTPILPFLTDTEENVRRILDYCFDAGVKGIVCFGMGLTLRDGAGDTAMPMRSRARTAPRCGSCFTRSAKSTACCTIRTNAFASSRTSRSRRSSCRCFEKRTRPCILASPG